MIRFRWTFAFVSLLALAVPAVGTAQSSARSMLLAMCEGDGCSRWEFHAGQATGTFADGAVASLTIVDFPSTETGKVMIRRVDTSGVGNGINGTYTGTRKGPIIEGTVDWKWPGHPDGHAEWFAVIMADAVHMEPSSSGKTTSVPSSINICEDGHGCIDWNFTGKTGAIPGVANLTVERSDDSIVVIRRNEISGALKGMEALYVGIRKGDQIHGVAAWKWSGQPPVGVVGWHTTLASGENPTAAGSAAQPPVVLGTPHSAFTGKIGMCEDSDGCSLWSFDHGRGQGHWRNGGNAQLIIEKLDSTSLEIARTDTSGLYTGLTAHYSATRSGDWMEGDLSWDWPGHGPGKTKFRAAIQSYAAQPVNNDPIEVPTHLLECDDADLCSDWNLHGRTGRARGEVVGYNGPLTVITFNESIVVVREQFDSGPSLGADIIYTGTRHGNHIQGVASWLWPGHGENSSGATNWHAIIENIPAVTISTTALNPAPFNLSGGWHLNDDHGLARDPVEFAQIGDEVRIRHWDHDNVAFRYTWFIGNELSTHRVAGQRLTDDGWQADEIEVADPDHVRFKSGVTLDRASMPQPNDAPCDQENSSKTWAYFAGLRGAVAYQQQNFPLAFCWMSVAANQGDAKGEAAVAIMLHDGVGTPQDFSKAFFWATQSAKLGNRMGESELMQMYANGEGTAKDPAKAENLRQFMAQQNVDAMWNELLHGNSQEAQLGRLALGAAIKIWQAESSGPDCSDGKAYSTPGCPGYRPPWLPPRHY